MGDSEFFQTESLKYKSEVAGALNLILARLNVAPHDRTATVNVIVDGVFEGPCLLMMAKLVPLENEIKALRKLIEENGKA